MDYTASGLLTNVRRVGAIPTSSSAGNTDADLLRHLNDELSLTIPAKLVSVREGFFRTTKDHTLVSGTTRYRLPYRALGNRIASATLLDSLGNTLRKLDEVSDTRLREFYSVNDCVGYRLEAGDMVLVPVGPVSTATTLRMRYYIRPNELTTSLDVASGRCFTVTAVGALNLTIMSGSGLTTSTKVDIIKGTPPFEHLQTDVFPTSVSLGAISFSSMTGVEVGDFICQAQYAPTAQVPGEFYPLLTHLAALKYALAKGDNDAVKQFEALLPKLEAEAVSLISPRNEQGSKKITSTAGAVGPLGNRYGRKLWGL